MAEILFTEEYRKLLITLLNIPTVNPMETGKASEIYKAQKCYENQACKIGFNTIMHEEPSPSCLQEEYVPITVKDRYKKMGKQFLECQPNMVLKLGTIASVNRTIMFNMHMDTVIGDLPISYINGRFNGRGAVDMKGAGVAVLAGINSAVKDNPLLTDNISVLIQCVSGEEGGAMGVYGTKLLADKGYIGRLNIFAEPTGGYFFDRSTTSMTLQIEVLGEGSTDDHPYSGDNATVLLGYLAQYFAKHLGQQIDNMGAKICIGGIHTGDMHNCVYGTGRLLMNFAYTSTQMGIELEKIVEDTFVLACKSFKEEFKHSKIAKKTVEQLSEICKVVWLKKGLPVLSNRNLRMEQILKNAGVARDSKSSENDMFTCDAMWVQGSDIYSIVFGPGNLKYNHAHAKGEYIDEYELEQYAQSTRNIVLEFWKDVKAQEQ